MPPSTGQGIRPAAPSNASRPASRKNYDKQCCATQPTPVTFTHAPPPTGAGCTEAKGATETSGAECTPTNHTNKHAKTKNTIFLASQAIYFWGNTSHYCRGSLRFRQHYKHAKARQSSPCLSTTRSPRVKCSLALRSCPLRPNDLHTTQQKQTNASKAYPCVKKTILPVSSRHPSFDEVFLTRHTPASSYRSYTPGTLKMKVCRPRKIGSTRSESSRRQGGS